MFLRPKKYSSFNSEADKMVFEDKDKWIIVDLEELHAYLKNNKLKKYKITKNY